MESPPTSSSCNNGKTTAAAAATTEAANDDPASPHDVIDASTDTITSHGRHNNIITTEGYTPLMETMEGTGTFQFSAGPSSESSSSSSSNGEVEDGSPFHDDNDNESHDENDVMADRRRFDVDYQDAASNALLALETEYRQCVSAGTGAGSTTCNSIPVPTTEGAAAANENTISAATPLSTMERDFLADPTFNIVATQTQQNDKEEEDNRIIAAAFDRRREEMDRIRHQEGRFHVNWDAAASASSAKEQKQQHQLSQFPQTNAPSSKIKMSEKDIEINAKAVQEAVQALTIKKKDAAFLQRYADWQRKQDGRRRKHPNSTPATTTTATHPIIPMASHLAFARNTPKAVQATANLTRSATLAEAISRILPPTMLFSAVEGINNKATEGEDTIANDGASASDFTSDHKGRHNDNNNNIETHGTENAQKNLLIDIVGADHVECASTEQIRQTLSPLVKWLVSKQDKRYETVHFRLIGRELMLPPCLVDQAVDLLEGVGQAQVGTQTISSPGTLARATASCHSAVYHELLEELQSDNHTENSFTTVQPHLAVAFNAGIWGYREWETTIEYLAQCRSCTPLPFLATAYTLSECHEDFATIERIVTASLVDDGHQSNNSTSEKPTTTPKGNVLWKPEDNFYGSKVVRTTQSSTAEYRENAYWQAWLLGG